MLNWTQRPQKDDARNYALANLGPRQRSLWLPGEESCCVKKAIELGVLKGQPKTIFVERNPNIVPAIKQFSATLSWTPVIHEGELSSLTIPFPLDYAFLDFLSTIDLKTMLWMQTEMAPKLAPNAVVTITHGYGYRNNKFLYALRERMMATQAFKDFKMRVEMADQNILFPMFLFKCIFYTHDFYARWPIKYKDSVRSMTMFQLENFRAGGSFYPPLQEYLEKGGTPMPAKTPEARSMAAKKANETRKRVAAEKAQKRHNAAVKAWATRRAMAAAN